MTSLRILRRCLGETRGAAAIEYALLAALIAAVVVAAVSVAGRSTVGLYTGANSALRAGTAGSSPP